MASEATATGPERNVLADLDSRIPTTFYWYLAVLACIGGFLFGYDTSNIGSALGFIPYHLSSFATGYLVAGASLGAAAGALVAGPLTDRFGRKILLVTDAGIYAVGAILSAVTVDAGMLLASRTLIGLAIGADSAIATAYIAEFAPRNRRGQLSIFQQWMITVGILVSYLVAVLVLRSAPGSAGDADWRHRVDIHTAETDHRPANALLIRPDVHIAWAAATGEPVGTNAPALREALWSWFGAPLKTTAPIIDWPS
jgi:SP family arabinose:H+ symporter-like MFS transporter